jgi:hypothetical protein
MRSDRSCPGQTRRHSRPWARGRPARRCAVARRRLRRGCRAPFRAPKERRRFGSTDEPFDGQAGDTGVASAEERLDLADGDKEHEPDPPVATTAAAGVSSAHRRADSSRAGWPVAEGGRTCGPCTGRPGTPGLTYESPLEVQCRGLRIRPVSSSASCSWWRVVGLGGGVGWCRWCAGRGLCGAWSSWSRRRGCGGLSSPRGVGDGGVGARGGGRGVGRES